LPFLIGLAAGVVVATSTHTLLGASALIAMPIFVLGTAAGYVLSAAVLFLRGLREPGAGAYRRDIDYQIEALAWVQIELPPASAGKAALLRTCDAARVAARRLDQARSTPGRIHRLDRKLKACVRIARWYQELLSGGLLAETDQRQTELIRSIEKEALPRIADQLVLFARDVDRGEILDLEIELKVLDRME
jgi:hypothetical protein